ncbi:MAG: hypothetical protein ACJ8GW_03305 [Massilia sp.]
MEKIRYIVRAPGNGSTLADFLTIIQNDPTLELLDTIGPAGMPHTAVVGVDPEQASAFEQRVRNLQHLMIEQDRPLSLFDKTAGFLHHPERKPHA